MKRYLRIYCESFKMNIKSAMSYELDFLIGIFAIVLKNVLNLCILYFIYDLAKEIVGWNLYETLLLYGLSTCSYAIWHCFFINTLTVPIYINNGTFDRMLLRPLGLIFQVISEGFDEDGWGDLVFGLAVTAFASSALHLEIGQMALLPIYIISGALVFTGIAILGSSLAFITVDHVDFSDITSELYEFSKYPTSIFKGSVKTIFTTIIPIGWIAYYPTATILNKPEGHILNIFISPIISILFVVLTCVIWKLSSKRYVSTGN